MEEYELSAEEMEELEYAPVGISGELDLEDNIPY